VGHVHPWGEAIHRVRVGRTIRNLVVALGVLTLVAFVGGCVQPFVYAPDALNVPVDSPTETPTPVDPPAAPEQVATPAFDVSPGTYNADLAVSISSTTSGATIRYTTDGSLPDENSTVFVEPIPVAGHLTSMTITAVATRDGMRDSEVATATYTINYDATNPPTFSPEPGSFATDQTVTISAPDEGAAVYFTTDGTEPQVSPSYRYETPVSVSGHGTSVTIRAIAVAPGKTTSSEASGTWAIEYQPTAPVTIAPTGGSFANDVLVLLETATDGASIYYTTDGSEPTQEATQYSEPFTVSQTGTTVRAIAVGSQMLASTPTSETYTLVAGDVGVNVTGGDQVANVQVTLSTATNGATIYYTTDGTTPTGESSEYAGPLTLSIPTTLKAVAVRAGYQDSAVAVQNYLPPAASVAFSVPGGEYTVAQSVELTTETPDATIHYTTDGSDPTDAAPVYSTSVQVLETMTIRAIALKPGEFSASAVSSATYTLTGAFFDVGFSQIESEFDGGNLTQTPVDNSGQNRLPVGTIIYIHTNQDRLAKMVLKEDNGTTYRYSLVSYNADGSVHGLRYDNWINPGTSVDVDLGNTYAGSGGQDLGYTATDETPALSFVANGTATMMVILP